MNVRALRGEDAMIGRRIVGLLVGFMFLPGFAWGQSATTSGIAGVVRDTTGAVLPGVTVEAGQNARQRSVVSDELLRALPTSTITMSNIGAITPGMAGTINVGGAAGVYRMSSVIQVSFHGKTSSKAQFDGMRINSLEGPGNQTAFLVSPATVEEWTVDTGAATAERIANGVVV